MERAIRIYGSIKLIRNDYLLDSMELSGGYDGTISESLWSYQVDTMELYIIIYGAIKLIESIELSR
eukprot:6088258-Prorocentrum_lima.AAC.1